MHSSKQPTDQRRRNKYFTNSERMRITQQSPPPLKTRHSHSSSQKSHSSRSRKPTPEPCHTSTLPNNWKPESDRKVKQSMTSSLLRSRRRHSRPNIEQQQSVVSEEQAAWFLALPDKVKRQHFSKEEQTLLADRCQVVLDKKSPKATQESAQEFCIRQLDSQSEKERKIKHRRRTSAPTLSRALDDTMLATIAAADAPEVIEDGESDKMAIINLYSRRHSVATTHENKPEPIVVTKAQIRSFRKSFALRPLPLPAPVLAPLPSPGFFKGRGEQRSAKLPTPLPSPALSKDTEELRPAKLKPRRRPTALYVTPPEPSPEAKHYKDPEMRRTLRAMSSPELFDEALEYGFPPVPFHNRLRSRFSANTSENDRSSSLTSSSTAETKDLPFDAIPSTPDGSVGYPESIRSIASSKPSSPHLLHRRAHTTSDMPTHRRTPSSINREMTLRMTLTRPILRAVETDVNAVHRTSMQSSLNEQYDPLALERLSICDDPTGAQGAFAINPETSQNLKGIKKALKHLVGK